MKARPRFAENEIVRLLNQYLTERNVPFTPFERIPVTGRRGPDLSINELNLAIDVKSRLECPKTLFNQKYGSLNSKDERQPLSIYIPCPKEYIGVAPHALFAIRLSDIGKKTWNRKSVKSLKGVYKYWLHMYDWIKEEKLALEAGIVLHRPKMAYADALLVVSHTGLINTAKTIHTLLQKERVNNDR